MTRPDDARIRHMIEAGDKAVAYSAGRSRRDLDADELFRLALTKLIEIIGEAAKQVSEDTQSRNPRVPWAEASRMRDRLIHHYFDINLDVLWATVTEDLPSLPERLREIEGVPDADDR